MTDLRGRKPILALDFDGVCHSYTSGWKGAGVIPDPPVPGLFEFIVEVAEDFEVNVWSSRSNQDGGLRAMKTWFVEKYRDWYNSGAVGGPCAYVYQPGGAICGYDRYQPMHKGHPGPIPPAGRHEYTPEKVLREPLTLAEATEIISGLLKFPTEKPPAFVGIDDRVLTFTGKWPSVGELLTFKPWFQMQKGKV